MPCDLHPCQKEASRPVYESPSCIIIVISLRKQPEIASPCTSPCTIFRHGKLLLSVRFFWCVPLYVCLFVFYVYVHVHVYIYICTWYCYVCTSACNYACAGSVLLPCLPSLWWWHPNLGAPAFEPSAIMRGKPPRPLATADEIGLPKTVMPMKAEASV